MTSSRKGDWQSQRLKPSTHYPSRPKGPNWNETTGWRSRPDILRKASGTTYHQIAQRTGYTCRQVQVARIGPTTPRRNNPPKDPERPSFCRSASSPHRTTPWPGSRRRPRIIVQRVRVLLACFILSDLAFPLIFQLHHATTPFRAQCPRPHADSRATVICKSRPRSSTALASRVGGLLAAPPRCFPLVQPPSQGRFTATWAAAAIWIFRVGRCRQDGNLDPPIRRQLPKEMPIKSPARRRRRGGTVPIGSVIGLGRDRP